MKRNFSFPRRGNKIPVIVTNAKSRIAYNIVRSLGQKGINVCTGDFVSCSMSFASGYSKGHFRYPSPFQDQRAFIKCLHEKIDSIGDCVLIPVHEETFLISKFKDQIPQNCKMVIPSYDQILMAHNKDRWQNIARRLEIPIPETYDLDNLRQNSHFLRDLHYPILIKPRQGGGGWAIKEVESAKDLEIILSTESFGGLPWGRYFCQEKVHGETHCVAMLFRQGELRGKIAYKQLREYPIAKGQATLRISIRTAAAEEYFRRFLEKMAWHGVCQADFVIDRETQIPYLVDINPRFWGSLAQAIASGVDFPHLVYRMAIEGDVEPVTTFRTGITTRWIGGDLRTFFPLLKKSESKVEFIRQFYFPQTKSTLFDDFSWKDPLPFFVWSLDAVLKMIKNHSLKPAPHDSLEGIWE
jgi:predicted ATP-grasp superfamily ATP-dependent carboligase